MSVSLLDVLEDAGYDIKNNSDDARWLLGQRDEFEELYEIADEVADRAEEWENEDECY